MLNVYKNYTKETVVRCAVGYWVHGWNTQKYKVPTVIFTVAISNSESINSQRRIIFLIRGAIPLNVWMFLSCNSFDVFGCFNPCVGEMWIGMPFSWVTVSYISFWYFSLCRKNVDSDALMFKLGVPGEEEKEDEYSGGRCQSGLCFISIFRIGI